MIRVEAADVTERGLDRRIFSATRSAFYEYASDVPPPSALGDCLDDVTADLESGTQVLLAYVDGSKRIAGVVRYKISKGRLWFFRLAVIPAQRRRGVASRLLQELIKVAEQETCSVVWCEVRSGAARNMALYQAHDFVLTGQRLTAGSGFTRQLGVMSRNVGDGA